MAKTKESGFHGFYPESFDFLLEIGLRNEKAYFESRREEYERLIHRPLIALEEALAPEVLAIDPRVRTGKRCISRIYRDTRFSRDKSPLRDHMWIAYKQPEMHLSESFCYYFEISAVGYAYGVGMYAPLPAFMAQMRARGLANPARLEKILTERTLTERFFLQGEDYARPKVEGVNPLLYAFLNKRYLSMIHTSDDIAAACRPELLDEFREAIQILAPVYRFAQGLDEA